MKLNKKFYKKFRKNIEKAPAKYPKITQLLEYWSDDVDFENLINEFYREGMTALLIEKLYKKSKKELTLNEIIKAAIRYTKKGLSWAPAKTLVLLLLGLKKKDILAAIENFEIELSDEDNISIEVFYDLDREWYFEASTYCYTYFTFTNLLILSSQAFLEETEIEADDVILFIGELYNERPQLQNIINNLLVKH